MKHSFFKTLTASSITLCSMCALAGNGNNGLPDKFQSIIDRLDDPDFGLEEIKHEIRTIEATVLDPDYGLEEIAAEINSIKDAVDSIGDNGLVPFKVSDTTGGICNTAAVGSANPEIHIDSDGTSGNFVVTSILIKTGGTGVPTTGFTALSINTVTIDGLKFDTRTGNLVGATDGSAVLESADLMGTPVRRSSFSGDKEPGGNFPHQIVAESDGNTDIKIRLFCRTDDSDLDISAVAVSGWKQTDENISVSYIPGN